MYRFLKDLLTSRELGLFVKRWNICKLLARGDLSYEKISSMTGSGYTTITRVARHLKNEPYLGYRLQLNQSKDGSAKLKAP
jgi:uncharacterized protein YerC